MIATIIAAVIGALLSAGAVFLIATLTINVYGEGSRTWATLRHVWGNQRTHEAEPEAAPEPELPPAYLRIFTDGRVEMNGAPLSAKTLDHMIEALTDARARQRAPVAALADDGRDIEADAAAALQQLRHVASQNLAYAQTLERSLQDAREEAEQQHHRADRLQALYIRRTQQALAAGMRIVIDYGPDAGRRA